MEQNPLTSLYRVVQNRRANPAEGSYTCYLFSQGLDKILKKCGEECAETIIAAKNGNNTETAGEICDLTYHMLVLMALQGITPEELRAILEQRHGKAGNLKQFKSVDKNS